MTRLGVFFLWLVHFLPFRVLAWSGNMLGLLLHLIARERRMVASTNLRLCFPEMSEPARAHLVRRNFMAFGRSFLERSILWWSSNERILSLIRVEGLEHFNAVQGRPYIGLLPHFVALDVAGAWLSLHTHGVSVYSNQKNAYLNKLLIEKRTRFGDQRIFSRQQGLRPIVKAMREGYPLLYLPDQDFAARDAMFIPFFGVPASTLTSASRLAQMTGSRILPCIPRVLPDGQGYEIRFYPAWENYPTGDAEADARRINEFIEQRVLEMPEQYFWLHKRFKTRPEGEEKFY
ncbi:MAG: lipid A biosynthesis acyltransferase [Gallionellaceae bacterium]